MTGLLPLLQLPWAHRGELQPPEGIGVTEQNVPLPTPRKTYIPASGEVYIDSRCDCYRKSASRTASFEAGRPRRACHVVSMISYPKLTLTSLSLNLSLHLIYFSLHSSLCCCLSLLHCSVALLLRCSVSPLLLCRTEEWLTYEQPRLLQRVRVPKQFYGISQQNADVPCVFSSRLQSSAPSAATTTIGKPNAAILVFYRRTKSCLDVLKCVATLRLLLLCVVLLF